MKRTGMAIALLFLAGCGGGGSKGVSDNQLVWCVVADEPGVVQVKDGYVIQVTAEYQQEYPELHMSKQECDAVPH